MKLVLTDGEWMSLIDGTRGVGTLQKCCANISALRDEIIQIARDGGACYLYAASFLRAYVAVAAGHDGLDDIPALVKVRDACLACEDISLDTLRALPHADREYVE